MTTAVLDNPARTGTGRDIVHTCCARCYPCIPGLRVVALCGAEFPLAGRWMTLSQLTCVVCREMRTVPCVRCGQPPTIRRQEGDT